MAQARHLRWHRFFVYEKVQSILWSDSLRKWTFMGNMGVSPKKVIINFGNVKRKWKNEKSVKVEIKKNNNNEVDKERKLTCDETVLSDGNRSNSFPKRVGWFGYWVRQYSSRAHWDFSCNDSICAISDRPHASKARQKREKIISYVDLKREKKRNFCFNLSIKCVNLIDEWICECLSFIPSE